MIIIHLTDLSLDRGNIFWEETNSAKDALLLSLWVALDLVLELLDLTLHDRVAWSRRVRGQPQDVALALEQLIDLLEPDVVLHDAAEFLEGGLLHDGRNARETLSHDGDKQVHEDKLNDDGGQDEHNPDDARVVFWIVVLVEVTQASEVSMDHCIKGRNTNEWIKDNGRVIMDPVLVQHKDDVGEGTQRDEKHHKEHFHIFDDLSDHTDECTERFEQAHPVEKLEPHQEETDWGNDRELVRRNAIGSLTINVESVQGKRPNIDNVPHIKEVCDAIALDLNDFQDEESHEGFTKDHDADDLHDERNAQLWAFVLREVTWVGNECYKVEDEGYE